MLQHTCKFFVLQAHDMSRILRVPIIFVRNICGCVRYAQYGNNTFTGSISDETEDGLCETILPTAIRHSIGSNASVNGSANGSANGSMNGNEGDFLSNSRINRFSDDGCFD